jgi:hypothetical protein
MTYAVSIDVYVPAAVYRALHVQHLKRTTAVMDALRGPGVTALNA